MTSRPAPAGKGGTARRAVGGASDSTGWCACCRGPAASVFYAVLPWSIRSVSGFTLLVIARSGATKQSSSRALSKRPWIASLPLARTFVLAARQRPSQQCTRKIASLKQSEGSGAPTGASIHWPCLRGTAARLALTGRARLSALHRGACRSDRTQRLSPGRASRDRDDAGITCAVDRA